MTLVILDRDGVINQERDNGQYVTCPNELILIDGAVEAIASLTKADYRIAIATNQAGIARGFYSHEMLASIHHKLLRAVRAAGGDIDRIVYCPSYDDEHPWRKPNPGMLLDILSHTKHPPQQVHFVGDSITDMIAGITIGCRLMLVQTGKGKQTLSMMQNAEYQTLKTAVTVVADLTEAAQKILHRDV